MQAEWIERSKMEIPTGNRELRVLLFTPNTDPTIRYRVVSADDTKRLREATHWQPLLDPTPK